MTGLAAVRAPFWQRDRMARLPQTIRRDAVSIEQRSGAWCQTCGKAAHLAPIAPDIVLALTARRFGITLDSLLSHRRAEQLVVARAFAVWALRSLGQATSYPAIGRALGGRDHTTIINLHQKAIWLRLSDTTFRRHSEELAARFYALREHT